MWLSSLSDAQPQYFKNIIFSVPKVWERMCHLNCVVVSVAKKVTTRDHHLTHYIFWHSMLLPLFIQWILCCYITSVCISVHYCLSLSLSLSLSLYVSSFLLYLSFCLSVKPICISSYFLDFDVVSFYLFVCLYSSPIVSVCLVKLGLLPLLYFCLFLFQ